MSGRWSSLLALTALLVIGSCKSRGGDSGGGSGSAGSSSLGPDGVRLTLAQAADAPKTTVTVLPAKPLPVAIERYTLATEAHFDVVKLVELGPESPTAVTGGTLAIAIKPGDLPTNARTDQLRAVGVGKYVAPEDLEVKADGDNLTIAIKHVAFVMVLAPKSDATLLGTPAKILVSSTRLLTLDACTEWLTPTSPGIAALAKDPAKFAVGTDGAIAIDAKLATMAVDAEGELSKPDDVLRRGGGDSANISIVIASLFLARGETVGLLTGFMTYVKDGITYRGLWQWAQVVHDGKPYFVDAFDPANLRLVPVAEATAQFKLWIGRYCTRTPTGAKPDAGVWRTEAAPGSGVGSGTKIPVTIPQ